MRLNPPETYWNARSRETPISAARRLWLAILLGVIFGSADLVRLNPIEFDRAVFEAIRYAGLAAGILGLVISGGMALLRHRFHVTPLITTWLILGSLLLISAIVNSVSSGVYGALWYLLGVPVLCFYLVPRILGVTDLALLAWGLIIGDLPLLVISVSQYPLAYPFMGATGNPNSLGVISATVGCAFLGLLGILKVKYRPWTVLLLSCGLLASVLLTLASGSRTSALTLVAVALLFTWDLFSGASGWLRTSIAAGVVASLLALGVFVATAEESGSLVSGIFSKGRESRGTFLPQRSEIWSQAVAEATVFGHGEGYFKDRFFLDSHNSVVGVCGQYGFPAAIVFLILGGLGITAGWRYHKRHRHQTPYALMPLLLQVCFWGLSMGEGIFGLVAGSINVAFLMALGVTQFRAGPAKIARAGVYYMSPPNAARRWPASGFRPPVGRVI